MRKALVIVLIAIAGVAFAAGASSGVSPKACLTPGQWFTPSGDLTRVITQPILLKDLAAKRVVLLGEHHDDADHHRWQLQVITALHAQHPRMVVGMEMLPRSVQPVLDQWVAGQLTETELLRQTGWARVWGFDAAMYLPILHFARLNRIPVIGVNVDRKLISAIGEKGLAALPLGAREGVSIPAPASSAYRSELTQAFKQHGGRIDNETDLARFVEAQLFWDRAFAEGLAAAANQPDRPLVVGIIGTGHLQGGNGVPHQLAELGIGETAVLLPVDSNIPCGELPRGVAHAVFAVAPGPAQAAQRPKLGVRLEPGAEGVRIAEVTAGSVADQAGLKAGDVVREVASRPVTASGDVTGAVARQAPGTWLPLKVARNGSQIELVAKFPPEP